MEAEDPLSQLADIHLPSAISLWPPAPGWWVTAALILVALLWLARNQYLIWQQTQRMQRALNELTLAYSAYNKAIQSSPDASNQAGLDLLYAINSLLKRVALVHFPEHEIAALSGRAWLEFLGRSSHGISFTSGAGTALADGEYRPVFDADVQTLTVLARTWIKQQYAHKRNATNSQAVTGKLEANA